MSKERLNDQPMVTELGNGSKKQNLNPGIFVFSTDSPYHSCSVLSALNALSCFSSSKILLSVLDLCSLLQESFLIFLL